MEKNAPKTGRVIRIKFREDLVCPKLNRLRSIMELGAWRAKWREAREANDWDAMDRLDKEYDMVGLP